MLPLGFFLKDIKMIGTGKVSEDSPWRVAGSITAQRGALTPDARKTATVDAIATAHTIKINNKHPSAYALLLRFRTDGNAEAVDTLQLYTARGDDHYHRIAKLTVRRGEQDTDEDTIHFCDLISPDNEDALFEGQESDLEDMIAHYYVRTLGFDKFLLLSSNKSSTTIYVDYCLLYE